ncbi:P-loop containing nucleoside triphosphate hydrolase protein [Desarmillaria tabescens]|uniref:P-loop containing nucleoside triphosphate hydrolase protein n=1 Tax=Armillaria tabescens TaxID=1929756 RepID=A0AA39T547_ARMTA|nr:P-loop containing nucleoside triphosphate hydrolase protein [Desarmillaria tabescens]KAK0465311.1 P-loop containing nucleoside triphosphate hydrolase protein [Desarmillaria tabescens]
MTETESTATFESLGLSKPLLDAVEKLGYKQPTSIQQQCIPPALEGRDIIGLAPWQNSCFRHSNSTKTSGMHPKVFLLASRGRYGCSRIAKRPHILVATPGRIADHLRNTKGFSLRTLKFMVLDEADRLLDLDFGTHLDDVLKAAPKQRTTYLFSATMTTKAVKVTTRQSNRPSAYRDLRHHITRSLPFYSTTYLYPIIHREALLVSLINSSLSNSIIVFVRTIHDAHSGIIILRTLNFDVVPLHGDLTRSQRMGTLAKFRSGDKKILVATDVASRGLDIPLVDLVINFDVLGHSKDYIHRVGRTARAGRAGKAIMIVTQYDVELLQRLECLLGKKLEEWPTDKEDVIAMHPTVDEAGRNAANELREAGKQQRAANGIEEVSLLRGSTQARRNKKASLIIPWFHRGSGGLKNANGICVPSWA